MAGKLIPGVPVIDDSQTTRYLNNLATALSNIVLGKTKLPNILRYDGIKPIQNNDDLVHKHYVDTTLQELDGSTYSKLDGTVDYTGIVSYDSGKTFTLANQIITKGYADTNFTKNPQQTGITNAGALSATYSQAEVNDLANKVTQIIVALRNSNIISS